jgi:hypothetical protein
MQAVHFVGKHCNPSRHREMKRKRPDPILGDRQVYIQSLAEAVTISDFAALSIGAHVDHARMRHSLQLLWDDRWPSEKPNLVGPRIIKLVGLFSVVQGHGS